MSKGSASNDTSRALPCTPLLLHWLAVAFMTDALGGRENAYNTAFCGLVVCGAVVLLLSTTVETDEAAVQAGVRDAIGRGFRPVSSRGRLAD